TEEGQQAICLVPRAQPEGTSVTLEDRTFALTTGRPVRFELWSSTRHKYARPGELYPLDEASGLEKLPPIQTVVRTASGAGEVQVKLQGTATEIGTLAVYCVAGDERFKLEFQVRGEAGAGALSETGALPRRFDEAVELVGKFFGRKPAADV